MEKWGFVLIKKRRTYSIADPSSSLVSRVRLVSMDRLTHVSFY